MRAVSREFRALTIPGAFAETVDLFPERPALIYRDHDGGYTRLTYRQLGAAVDQVADSLRRLGVRKGDKIAICAYHGADWVIADLAVLKLGAIVVPVYHNLSPQSVAYVLRDSGARMIFAEDARVFEMIEQIRGDLPVLRTVVVFAPQGLDGRKGFIEFTELKSGRGLSCEAARADEVPLTQIETSPDDIATIVYTSGTTGEPKGVVLTHAAVVSNTVAGIRRFRVAPEDVFLSVLPMCHMLAKIAGCYSHLFAGSAIVYGGAISDMLEDAKRFRPTNLAVVPRIIEKIYEVAAERVERSSAPRRRMVHSAIANLNRRANLRYKGERVPPVLHLKCWFYDRTVAARFRRIVGGRLRFVVSGGAPLDKKLAKLLWILGFNIVEGYGLTEASLVVSTCTVEDNHLGTVGKPYPGVEVKIGDNEEILVRGPSLMKGYFNRPEDTAAAIDKDGWLHTGDQGRFDDRGNLIITGRIKEIIVTSYGKNIGPALIEGEITRSPYIDQAMLCGDKQKYLTALIVPNKKMMEAYADRHNLWTGGYPDLLKNETVRRLIADEIEKATADSSPHEKVKNFALLPEGFGVENDLLTPTLKLRRSRIEQRHAAQIAAMYSDAGQSP